MDFSQIKELIAIIQQSDFTSFSIKVEDIEISLSRAKSNASESVTKMEVLHSEINVPVEENKMPTNYDHYIKSPLVGTFYASPAPGKSPFVKMGDRVKKGDVLCIIEAMKLMNEITSDVDGVVKEIFAESEQLIQYGQDLFGINKGEASS